jgi:hypothetical protein
MDNIVDELGPFLALSGKSMAKIRPWICKGILFLSYAADFSASWQHSCTLNVAKRYKESTFVLLVEVLPNRWQSSSKGLYLGVCSHQNMYFFLSSIYYLNSFKIFKMFFVSFAIVKPRAV